MIEMMIAMMAMMEKNTIAITLLVMHFEMPMT